MSELLDPPVAHPVTSALETVCAAVDQLRALTAGGVDGELWTMSSPGLLETAATLHRLACRVDATTHEVVREIDVRGAAVEAGAPSTAAWLRGRLRLHPGAAKRTVATARGLHDDPTAPLVTHVPGPETTGPVDRPLRAAFAAGDICGEHASVACQVMSELPPGLAESVRSEAEGFLAEQAVVHDPRQLARMGRHLRHVLDPDGGDGLSADEEHDRARQVLDVRRRNDGSSDVTGHLGAELTADLLAQIQPLAAPNPSTDGVRDLRTTGQRNADALAELLRRAAISGTSPSRHGSRTTITVTMALETLERRLGSPAAMLDWSGPISAETARRLACDAHVIPVVLDAKGEPLDVGRASYPVTQAIWRALVVRDGGCSFAGCDRPPEWTEAHHRVHWEDGGETSLANCCLLCDFHHRLVHHHGWQVDLVDGSIRTIPPPWVDPSGTPRRNSGRAQLATLASLTHLPDDPG